MKRFRLFVLAAMLFCPLLLDPITSAQNSGLILNTGDLLVSDVFNGIVRIDPSTGVKTVIASGQSSGVAVEKSGDIVAGMFDCCVTGLWSITRIDRETGAQTTISAGNNLNFFHSITVAPDGGILVAGHDALVRVDPGTGSQTVISSGGQFVDLRDVVVAPNGDIYVTDTQALGLTGAVFRVDEATGAQQVIATGSDMGQPVSIAAEANGSLIVGAYFGTITRVDPTTGTRSALSGVSGYAGGLDVAANGEIYVVSWNQFGPTSDPGVVTRIDPNSGAGTIVASSEMISRTRGLAIYPVVTGLYNFSGFFQPVDNLPTLNVVNAGSAIPVKFSLNGNQGLAIFAAAYPVSQQIACSNGAPVSTIEETVTAGYSSLSYEALTDQYTYVWKTNKAWKDSCRQLLLRLNDGSAHMANFQFK